VDSELVATVLNNVVLVIDMPQAGAARLVAQDRFGPRAWPMASPASPFT